MRESRRMNIRMNNLVYRLFSFRGKLQRKQYWVYTSILLLLQWLVAVPLLYSHLIIRSDEHLPSSEYLPQCRLLFLLGFAIFVICIVALLAIQVRRVRDIGWSLKWLILFYVAMAVPVIGRSVPLVLILLLGTLPSDSKV